MSPNQTLFQFFQWYVKPEENLWGFISEHAPALAGHGITHVWLPPPYKSSKGVHEPGYAVYDLYDLGEFDQKGSVRTLYGTKEEYLAAIDALHKHKVSALGDIVFNHRMGGDEKEWVHARKVSETNREKFISGETDIEVPSRFTFPGRQGKYNTYQWHSKNFTGTKENGSIFLFLHEFTEGRWERSVAKEQHNYDYLLGMDIEFRNPDVINELTEWGKWFINETGIDGFRLDGLKHIHKYFFPGWIEEMKRHAGKELFVVGEYWDQDPAAIEEFSDDINGIIRLFDIPLHFAFAEASKHRSSYDLRQLRDKSLAARQPLHTVTFVDNHDTQPCRNEQALIHSWFRPLAYTYILLRNDGVPCVFYPDLYGASYTDKNEKGHEIHTNLTPVPILEKLLKARRDLAYGPQHDYWEKENVIGWTRAGDSEYPLSGLAAVISNGMAGILEMSMGEQNAGRILKDMCGNISKTIQLDESGTASFLVSASGVSVWIDEKFPL